MFYDKRNSTYAIYVIGSIFIYQLHLDYNVLFVSIATV